MWLHKPVLGPAAKQTHDWMRGWVVGRRGDPPGLPLGGPTARWHKSRLVSCAQQEKQAGATCQTATFRRESGLTQTRRTTMGERRNTVMRGTPQASCRGGSTLKGAIGPTQT